MGRASGSVAIVWGSVAAHIRFKSALAVCALGLAASGCGSDDNFGPVEPAVVKAPIVKTKPGLYFISGEQFVDVSREGVDSRADLTQLITELIQGPTESEAGKGAWTDIPRWTKLIEASLSSDGATAEISFSSSFEDNAGIAKATRVESLYARLGQVAFTATSLPGVNKVVVDVPGTKPVALSRSDFSQPAPGKRVTGATAEAVQLATDAPAEASGSLAPAPVPSTPAPKPQPTKPAVSIVEVQKKLAELGYLPIGYASGTSDYRTQQAVMAFQGWEGLGRDGVAGPLTVAKLSDAQRPQPTGIGSGRRVEIHRAEGVLMLVENGRTVRALHTSTGTGGNSTETGTPPGSFKVYRKELRSWSVPFKTWLPYASYWNGGWAMHESPDVPNFPASHGCARLPAPEAPVAYEFAAVGTPVTVY